MSSAIRLPSVADLDLRGKRVFIRADLNVPLRGAEVADASRIEASRETLDFVRSAGGRFSGAGGLRRW